MCSEVVRANPSSNCFILNNHGALVVGKTIEEAFCRLELFERISRISLGLSPLSSPPQSTTELFLSTLTNPSELETSAFSLHPACEVDAKELHAFALRAYTQV